MDRLFFTGFQMAAKQSDMSITLNDGHQMPLLGLGTSLKLLRTDGVVKKETCERTSVTAVAVEAALTAGYRHIDAAYMYLNEEAVGEGIRAWMKKTGGKRSDLFITTKLPFMAMHPEQVQRFLKMSLKSLGLDYVDLYLVHLPMGTKYTSDTEMVLRTPDGELLVDYGTDIIAIWKEMVAIKQLGLAKSIGVSNFTVKQLRRLMAQPMTPPAVNQVELQAEFQQPALCRYCAEEGVALTGYGNLGSPGRRGTPSEKGTTIPSLLDNPIIQLVADNNKVEPAQVLLRYWVQQGIAVLPKSITPSRIVSNSKIFGWALTSLEMKAIATLDRGEEGRSFRFFKRGGWETHPECPAPVDD